ncbi:hypothetical protein XL92_004256 [Salmonella enterica subsp. enterica]|nr:hypothetical protein [Salmonella enterica subsp. enterica]
MYVENPLRWADPLGLAPQPHGNSKASDAAQHGYEITDTRTGQVVKTGVSSGRIRLDGKSYRAEKQVRDWNSEPGNAGRYSSKIVYTEPAGPEARERILEWEKQNAARHANTLDPKRHQRP